MSPSVYLAFSIYVLSSQLISQSVVIKTLKAFHQDTPGRTWVVMDKTPEHTLHFLFIIITAKDLTDDRVWQVEVIYNAIPILKPFEHFFDIINRQRWVCREFTCSNTVCT